jgi:hypothetical protein
MTSALTSLEQYHKDGAEFLNHIVRVTGDETWVSFVNVETKEQSKQWMHTHSPNKTKKFKQTLSACLKATVFWNRKGVLMVEFMQQGTTITSKVYCEKLKKKTTYGHSEQSTWTGSLKSAITNTEKDFHEAIANTRIDLHEEDGLMFQIEAKTTKALIEAT